MQTYKILTLAVSLAALTACETGPSHNEMAQLKINESGVASLTMTEIKETLLGNSINALSKKGNPWEMYYQDSTMLGHVSGADWEETDHGTWEATADDEYCRQWAVSWGKQQRRCSKLYKTSDNELVFVPTDGSRNDIATLSNGDAFGLQ